MGLEHRAGLARAFPSKLSMIGSMVKNQIRAGKASGPGAALRGMCNF